MGEKAHFFFDESGFNADSLSMLCCVVLDQPTPVRESILSLKEDILHSGRLSEIRGNFETNGFHYCENHHEIRAKFFRLLPTLDFEAYICFVPSTPEEDHRNELYDRMYGRLLYDRMQKYRDRPIEICFEQHDSRVTRRLTELREITLRIDEQIKSQHGINDIAPPIVISAGKEEPCLAIADYVSAIFRKYYEALNSANAWKKGEPFEKRDFDDLRPKVRLIHNFETEEFFSRHKPFPYAR